MEIQFEAVEPNVWKPKETGDSIEGFLISKRVNVGSNESRMYNLENDKGQFFVWGSTVLDDRMQYVNPGDYIRITFKEVKKNSKGQPTKIFKVEKSVTHKEELVK